MTVQWELGNKLCTTSLSVPGNGTALGGGGVGDQLLLGLGPSQAAPLVGGKGKVLGAACRPLRPRSRVLTAHQSLEWPPVPTMPWPGGPGWGQEAGPW